MTFALTLCADTGPPRDFWPLRRPSRAELSAKMEVTTLRPASPPRHIEQN